RGAPVDRGGRPPRERLRASVRAAARHLQRARPDPESGVSGDAEGQGVPGRGRKGQPLARSGHRRRDGDDGPRALHAGRDAARQVEDRPLQLMRIGFHLTPFWSPTDRHPTQIIDEAIEVVGAASRMGYAWVSIGHHLLSHPTMWPQPLPMLARLAPEAGRMRLKTSMLLLPLVSPVDAAENIATLDHITHGRLDVGVSVGYREQELETVGLGRQDRVPKLEESLALMKRLWAGEAVTLEGRYTRVTAVRPRPPPRGLTSRRPSRCTGRGRCRSRP